MERERAEKSPEELIAQADSFYRLYQVVKGRQITLKGSRKLYRPEDLLEIIRGIEDSSLGIDFATQTGGFRAKLQELLEKRKKDEDKGFKFHKK